MSSLLNRKQPAPSAEAVRVHLSRILTSAEFSRCVRLQRFLSFLTDRRLSGFEEGAKEYTLGIEVFDRGPAFDPRLDSIVRVEATRLREKLARFYLTEGIGEQLRFEVPRGCYSVIFRRQDAPVVRALRRFNWIRWAGGVAALGFTLAAGIGIGFGVAQVDAKEARQIGK